MEKNIMKCKNNEGDSYDPNSHKVTIQTSIDKKFIHVKIDEYIWIELGPKEALDFLNGLQSVIYEVVASQD